MEHWIQPNFYKKPRLFEKKKKKTEFIKNLTLYRMYICTNFSLVSYRSEDDTLQQIVPCIIFSRFAIINASIAITRENN